MPSTPQFVVSEKKFFSSAPNISTGAKSVGVWKTKIYLEELLTILNHSQWLKLVKNVLKIVIVGYKLFKFLQNIFLKIKIINISNYLKLATVYL